MLVQQCADQCEASLVLWQISFGVCLDFHQFLACSPNNQKIRRVSVDLLLGDTAECMVVPAMRQLEQWPVRSGTREAR
jgi:hypothetical protein